MKRLLGKPSNGWSNFTFDKRCRISYIDPFPDFVIEDGISFLNNNIPFDVTFDAEGYEYRIFADKENKMFYEILDGSNKIYPLNCDFKTFFNNLLLSIENDFDAWCNFYFCIEEDTENEFEKHKKELRNRLDKAIEILGDKTLECLEDGEKL